MASAVIGQFVEWQLNRVFNRGSGRLSNSRSQSKLKHRHMEIAMNKLILAAPALLATALAFGLSRASPRTHKPSGIYSLLQHSCRAIDVFRAGFSAGKKSRSGERLGKSTRAIRANGSALRLHVLRQSAERQHSGAELRGVDADEQRHLLFR